MAHADDGTLEEILARARDRSTRDETRAPATEIARQLAQARQVA